MMTDAERQREIQRLAASVGARADQLASGVSDFLKDRLQQLDELAEVLIVCAAGTVPEFTITQSDAALLGASAILAAGITRQHHASNIASGETTDGCPEH